MKAQTFLWLNVFETIFSRPELLQEKAQNIAAIS